MSDEKKQQIIDALIVAYWMEMETVQNYLANSIDLDGVRAEEIKKSLAADIQEELTHAQRLATRVKELEGRVPGSAGFKATQSSLQPPEDSTDVVTVIRGVLEAEASAIAHYNKIIRLCEGTDYVTQDLAIQVLGQEEAHQREFRGFLKEYSKEM